MYISRFKLTNVRCFKELEIKFDSFGSSILLVGDNGDGKSTILRSLAMGLCDESSASALFRELPGEYVRRETNRKYARTGDEAVIEIDFAESKNTIYRIETRIISLKTFERVSQYDRKNRTKSVSTLWKISSKRRKRLDQDTFPWDTLFVSGYGAGIRTSGTGDYQHYLPVDAVYPLFRYDVSLQNPELAILRLVEAARKRRKTAAAAHNAGERMKGAIQKLFVGLLNLAKPSDFEISPTGIAVRGRWGRSELGELSDGYKSTITWVLDLLGWWLLKRGSSARLDPRKINGIILIDEIEQHLHPRWQQKVLGQLREAFPALQIIATTHSPIVASGSQGIPVHVLGPGKYDIVRPYGWLAEDVYDKMGLSESRSTQFVREVIDEYRKLDKLAVAGRSLTKDQQQALRNMRSTLAGLPESDPIAMTMRLENLTAQFKSTRKLRA